MENSGIPKTWEEAFEGQPIPAVRVLQKQLGASVSRDKEKLRILVGGNYRDLLSTADEIVALDARSKATEQHISNLSAQCKLSDYTDSRQLTSPYSSTAAQLRLLSQCILCASHALRQRSILLSAQLTVISGLLLKSLNEGAATLRSVDRLREQATSQRQLLLRRIDSHLIHPASNTNSMVESICAYCLIKSVSSSDAIQHFRDLRLNKLKQRFNDGAVDGKQLTESFQYFIISIQSLRSLLTRGVNEILSNLQRQPILEDPTIMQLETLGVDRVRNLIPQDVLSFTPYIKRVLMQKDEILLIVQEWSREASQIAAVGLKNSLKSAKSINSILSLRQELLRIILPVLFSVHAQDTLLIGIREAINQRLLELCKDQIETLLQIGSELLSDDSTVSLPPSLWDDSFVIRTNSSQNSNFLRHVQSRHLGTRSTLNRALKSMKSWTKILKQLRQQVEDLQFVRWQDIVEEVEEEEEEGPEETTAKIVTLLAKTDPETFEASIRSTVHTTIAAFEDHLRQGVDRACSEQPIRPALIVFFVRLLRESSSIIVRSMTDLQMNTTQMDAKLFKALANEVYRRLALKFESAPVSTSTAYPTTVTDELPSPLVFSALRQICTIMAELGGTDVWSATAVSTVKQILMENMTSEKDNKKRAYLENDFDEFYLKSALSSTNIKTSNVTNPETPEIAAAYWNRTKLLFGILS